MESAKRLVSSRASARPLSTVNRPLTGMASATGLMPPKSSRATASVRRQIQDKSYWMAVLNAKMNELHQEIARLTRATDQMKNNESRISLMQQAAAALAKELKEKSSLLFAYNEYFERLRFDDSINDVEKEIELAKEDNEALIEELEREYKEKKENEKALNNLESNFKAMQMNWHNFIMKLSPEQQQRYQELDQQNKQLNASCEQFEQQITQLKQRINQLEQGSELETDSIFRKEVLHRLERLRQLENQHEELFGEPGLENSYEDERSRLLAQVKQANRAINQIEQDRTKMESELSRLRAQSEEFTEESVSKYNEFYQQEKTINDFLIDYDGKRSEQLEQLTGLSGKIREAMENSSRLLTQIAILRDSSSSADQIDQSIDQSSDEQSSLVSNGQVKALEGQSADNRLHLLLNEKRKLTLDLAKIEQLKEKVAGELESLKLQIKQSNADIQRFDNVQQLKDQARARLDRLNERKAELTGRLEELTKSEAVKRQQFERIRGEFDRSNSIYRKISKFETRLADLEQRSKALYDEIEEYDYEHLKAKAFEELSKYNQKLIGFF